MIDKTETPIGSIIKARLTEGHYLICEVVETYASSCMAMVVECRPSGEHDDKIIGTLPRLEYDVCHGVECDSESLSRIGFVESDEKGWLLVYYFGDMKLLYRHDRSKGFARFRFKSSYSTRYVGFSCYFIHELQNMIHFLTGGELKFSYGYSEENTSVGRNIKTYQ